MTIDEALTDLSIQLEIKHRLGKDHQANAIKLGIEALKRAQSNRSYTTTEAWILLPGETNKEGGKE